MNVFKVFSSSIVLHIFTVYWVCIPVIQAFFYVWKSSTNIYIFSNNLWMIRGLKPVLVRSSIIMIKHISLQRIKEANGYGLEVAISQIYRIFLWKHTIIRISALPYRKSHATVFLTRHRISSVGKTFKGGMEK